MWRISLNHIQFFLGMQVHQNLGYPSIKVFFTVPLIGGSPIRRCDSTGLGGLPKGSLPAGTNIRADVDHAPQPPEEHTNKSDHQMISHAKIPSGVVVPVTGVDYSASVHDHCAYFHFGVLFHEGNQQ